MCNLEHAASLAAFGFIVDAPEIRTPIDVTERLVQEIADHGVRVEALRPAFRAIARRRRPDACKVRTPCRHSDLATD